MALHPRNHRDLMLAPVAAEIDLNLQRMRDVSPRDVLQELELELDRPAKPEAIKLAVKADDEHGRLGPDGKWHDAFLPADFTVHAGAKVTVTVSNYDGGAHTFTSPAMHLNAVIPAGSMQHPHETTFTFTAPKQAGRYAWWCAMPCDPWAMAHDGYMRGYVTVAA